MSTMRIIFSIGFLFFLLSCNNKMIVENSNITSFESPTKTFAPDYTVLQVWELPDELVEISGNVLIDNNRMACIQDNKGIIFIYNLKTKLIESTIPFAEDGDFEGLCKVGKVFYALRSDGLLFEINLKGNDKPIVTTFDLPFETINDTEPMCYDSLNNRILIGTKGKDITEQFKKGIYSFDLSTKTLGKQAVFYFENIEEELANGKNKKENKKGKKQTLNPSEIAVNYHTKELYILSGQQSQLIIANATGKIKSIIQLDKKVFPQPEGMCISSNGDLYISSEGGKRTKGIIAKVQL